MADIWRRSGWDVAEMWLWFGWVMALKWMKNGWDIAENGWITADIWMKQAGLSRATLESTFLGVNAPLQIAMVSQSVSQSVSQ